MQLHDSATIGDFYASVPVFTRFEEITDAELYVPLPEDWVLGLADVKSSTAAIARGGYKSVNMAGASVVAAVGNALGTHDFPFVFGGDGASFALPPQHAALARGALAACIAYAQEELAMSLRAALVPVSAVRTAGVDVRVARFAPSPDVRYAMFSGGGLAWAEKEMKRGAFTVEAAPRGTRPDLTGLSCRFEKVPSARGTILSLLVVPADRGASPEFWRLIESLLALTADTREAGRPVTRSSLFVRWPPTGLELEARARHKPWRPLWVDRIDVALRTLCSFLVFRFRIHLGPFSPVTYYGELVENSDFRKYDDALRMTLDCTERFADEIGALLADAARRGIARYGLHRQSDALVTCITPTMYGNHFHFIDGAAGGYAIAALGLKA
jgi:Protein of unknown function (DUF3095)